MAKRGKDASLLIITNKGSTNRTASTDYMVTTDLATMGKNFGKRFVPIGATLADCNSSRTRKGELRVRGDGGSVAVGSTSCVNVYTLSDDLVGQCRRIAPTSGQRGRMFTRVVSLTRTSTLCLFGGKRGRRTVVRLSPCLRGCRGT